MSSAERAVGQMICEVNHVTMEKQLTAEVATYKETD